MADCLTEIEWEMQYCLSQMVWGGSGSFMVTIGVGRAQRAKKHETHFHFWTSDTKVNRPDFLTRPWKRHYTSCNIITDINAAVFRGISKTQGFSPVGEIYNWCLCPLTSLDLNNNLSPSLIYLECRGTVITYLALKLPPYCGPQGPKMHRLSNQEDQLLLIPTSFASLKQQLSPTLRPALETNETLR